MSMEDFVTVDSQIVPDSSKQERSLDEKMDYLLSKLENVMNLDANESKESKTEALPLPSVQSIPGNNAEKLTEPLYEQDSLILIEGPSSTY